MSKGLWYRSRLDCLDQNKETINWGSVRAHCIARALADFISAGIVEAAFAPAIFDPRFFPWAWDEKQSLVSEADTRSLMLWAVGRWPDWSLKKFDAKILFTWLEVLSPGDQAQTLQILEKYYGLSRAG